jgi:VWFA-related protein
MSFRYVLAIFLSLAGISSVALSQGQSKPPSTESPLTVGILVDCSGSQRLQLDRTIGLVKQLSEAFGPEDQAFMVRFVDAAKISIVQEFTNQKSDLEDAAEGLYIEGGQTAILDAVDRSARYFAKNDPSNGTSSRALVLITDGEESGSGKRSDETVALLKDSQLKVYAIGLSDLKVSTKLLDKLTKETGGKLFTPRTTAEISNSVLEMIKLMRTGPKRINERD